MSQPPEIIDPASATYAAPEAAQQIQQRSASTLPERKMSLAARWRRDRLLVLLAAPGMVVLLLFQYIPLLGNVIAFQDFVPFLGITGSEWVGLDNFEVLVSGDRRFLNALANTLIIFFIQTVFAFPAPIVVALLLNSLLSEKTKRVVQSVLYLPHFLSWVIVVALFQQVIYPTGLLASYGIETNIIGNPDLFKALITSQVIWKDTGWGTILFLAALSRVDPNLYESTAMDGAGRMRQMWHVTLPALKPIIVLLLILKLGDVLTVGFEQIVLQQPAVGPGPAEVLDTYVYYNGILGGDWGVSAAVGLVKGLLGVVLVLGANKVAHLFGERGVYGK